MADIIAAPLHCSQVAAGRARGLSVHNREHMATRAYKKQRFMGLRKG